jgi:hypothetical protein
MAVVLRSTGGLCSDGVSSRCIAAVRLTLSASASALSLAASALSAAAPTASKDAFS